MSKIYCLHINNPDKREIGIEDLNNLTDFVKNLYIEKSDDSSKLNFVPYYSKATDGICIKIGGRSKANIANIEKVNSILKDQDLIWKYKISLSKPYEFNATQVLSFDVTSGRKWDSIVQQGPYFTEIMEPYKPLGASLFLGEQEYKLKPEEEKVAGFYARRKIAEEKDNITKTYTRPIKHETEAQKQARILFNKNFWKDFQTYLSPEAKKIFRTENDFLDIDWSDLIQKINDNKEKDDKNTKNRKNAEKIFRYGYATLNGVPYQKLSNFSVELSGIFYGVGANERLGRIKKQIFPEDVTLNLGKEDTIPKPPLGHKWGRIATHHNLEWVATWKDSVTGRNKYIWFSQEGAFKAQSDIIKYEKARQLHTQLNDIRTKYMIHANSSDKTLQQLGTVLYLIDHFGIRVGNEKDEDEAETVGATTLFFKNVDLDDTNKRVIFNFLGKDSVPFQKELEVDPIIFKNFQRLLEGKKTEEYNNKQIFQITSENINKYLKEEFGDFSAKVFRTRLANDIMYHALQNVEIPDKATNKVIKFNFAKANVEVAKVLNHSRSPSIKALESLEKLKTELETAKSKKDVKNIATLTQNIESKENVLSVAINTSLANYIDPRLVISWTKAKEVSPNAIYTATLLSKFKWAVESTEDGWDWENSPLENEDVSSTQPKTARTPSRKPSAAKTPRQPSVPRRPSPRQPSVSRKPSPRQPSAVPAKSFVTRLNLDNIFFRLLRQSNRDTTLRIKDVLKSCQEEDPELRLLLGFDTKQECKDKVSLLFAAHSSLYGDVTGNREINLGQFVKYFTNKPDITPPRQPSAARKPPRRQPSAAKTPPRQPSSAKTPPPPPQSSSKATFKIPPPRQKQDPFFGKLGPGTIKDYELLLQLCEDLKNYTNIYQVNPAVLDWIYPFCKEAVEKGVNIKATKFIVDYYEKNLLKRPEDDTPVMENVRKPPLESSDDALPIQPLPQKKKIQKADYTVPSDNHRFTYLNTYKNMDHLKKYCDSWDISIRPEYNMKQIKFAIMDLYKDTPIEDIPINTKKK